MEKVTSKDGTQIAYETKGSGSPLILVDGAICYRAFGPMPALAELLAQHFTVYMYDRRGRGFSTNGKPFAVAREVEDIDALIEQAGGSAFVYGISSGACLALEAAWRWIAAFPGWPCTSLRITRQGLAACSGRNIPRTSRGPSPRDAGRALGP